jgi:hypothetical protein
MSHKPFPEKPTFFAFERILVRRDLLSIVPWIMNRCNQKVPAVEALTSGWMNMAADQIEHKHILVFG